MEQNKNYRQLIRNLRTGLVHKLKIMQPPLELNALAQLIREEAISVQVCPPGTPELPYIKTASWRLSCRVSWVGHFELGICDGNITIRKCQLFDERGDERDGKISQIGYQGMKGDYASTMSLAKVILIPLADPESIKKTARIMKTWTH